MTEIDVNNAIRRIRTGFVTAVKSGDPAKVTSFAKGLSKLVWHLGKEIQAHGPDVKDKVTAVKILKYVEAANGLIAVDRPWDAIMVLLFAPNVAMSEFRGPIPPNYKEIAMAAPISISPAAYAMVEANDAQRRTKALWENWNTFVTTVLPVTVAVAVLPTQPVAASWVLTSSGTIEEARKYWGEKAADVKDAAGGLLQGLFGSFGLKTALLLGGAALVLGVSAGREFGKGK